MPRQRRVFPSPTDANCLNHKHLYPLPEVEVGNAVRKIQIGEGFEPKIGRVPSLDAQRIIFRFQLSIFHFYQDPIRNTNILPIVKT